MARLSPRPVKTFSIGFVEKDYDELDYARIVARAFGTEHHELVLKPDVQKVIEDLAWHLDEPFGDPSAIPTYMVSKLASEHVTVVLSGDGGDELFGGYDKYVVEERERRYPVPTAARAVLGMIGAMMPEGMRGRNFVRHFSLAGFERYLDAVTLFKREAQKKLFSSDAFEQLSNCDPWRIAADHLVNGNAGNAGWLSAVQHFDLKGYLPLDILSKVDRMSMAHSLEARVPLLDHKFVEFAARIPPDL